MNIEEAIQILKDHNKWRRGADMPMTNPKILGEAIDCVVDANVEIVAQSYGKGFTQGQEVGERETIEKACKWIRGLYPPIDGCDYSKIAEGMVIKFRKAMED